MQTLSPRQEQFVSHYLATGNASRSYIAAGYSPRAARACASRLLTKANIRAAIEQQKRVLANESGVAPEQVVAMLMTEAQGSGRDTTASARVSALRTLADIHGLLGGQQRELPSALTQVFEAIGRGAREQRQVNALPAGDSV